MLFTKTILISISLFSQLSFAFSSNIPNSERFSVKLEAEQAVLNSKYAVKVDDIRLSENKGVSLKEEALTRVYETGLSDPDLYFEVVLPEGRYQLSTHAYTDSFGAELMHKATSKHESIYMKLQIDDGYPVNRVVYVPWDVRTQVSGVFYFSGGEHTIKLWLPKGIKLDYIHILEYIPPRIPDKAANYIPAYTPPSTHPRLWVNDVSLEVVKSRLHKEENKKYWKRIKDKATLPYTVTYDEDKVVSHNVELENIAREKAFYFLMTNDTIVGKAAIELVANYVSRVEFDNLLDITREIGRAIYNVSLVYDWCYYIMSDSERELLLTNLMRLADKMEIGWPPFRQSVLTGHGGEAQLHRDLLAMSIAIYDEDPVPYKYCSYRVLEELVPMRDWQYQSPRHNQGVNYGAYRSQWDIHAAWLFYRMTGKEVFNENLKKFPYYWIYMRLPNGQMLRDGDGFGAGKPGEFFYWGNALTQFLFYTYANDPKLKGEFIRQGGRVHDPILFLLLNDPELEADENLDDLPLTIDFGPILGSMVARTGWKVGMDSDDVVVEVKGGGYHFGNHQHSDAGSIQLFYRGFQVGDLGVYGFYGTPYDMNFNKRSISHSMMLAVDPKEDFGNRITSNDGGTRFNQHHPDSPQAAMSNPRFHNGSVISTDFGPSNNRPLYSYFSVDLKGAYSDKIESYTRQFCFINLENDSLPAVVVMLDKMTTSHPEFKKFWQINTHMEPIINDGKFILHNSMQGRKGETHVQLLLPNKDDYEVELFSGNLANSSFGEQYEVPARATAQWSHPETNGHRLMVSPIEYNKTNHFLTAFHFVRENQKPYNINMSESEKVYMLSFGEFTIIIQKELPLLDEAISFTLPQNDYLSNKVILLGFKEGKWNIAHEKNGINFNVEISSGNNTIYFQSVKGSHTLTPIR